MTGIQFETKGPFHPLSLPGELNPLAWQLHRRFLATSAIHVALRSWFQHYDAQGREIRRQLIKRPDGSMTFLDGTPIKTHELIPGVKYDVIERPWLQ